MLKCYQSKQAVMLYWRPIFSTAIGCRLLGSTGLLERQNHATVPVQSVGGQTCSGLCTKAAPNCLSLRTMPLFLSDSWSRTCKNSLLSVAASESQFLLGMLVRAGCLSFYHSVRRLLAGDCDANFLRELCF